MSTFQRRYPKGLVNFLSYSPLSEAFLEYGRFGGLP